MEEALRSEPAELEYIGERLYLLERALDIGGHGVVITDPNVAHNPIIYANAGFEQITGYSVEEVIGRDCRVVTGENQAGLSQLRAAIWEGREWSGIVSNHRKDGAPFYSKLVVSPVRDEEGRLSRFVWVISDVTDRVRTEEALRKGEGRFRRVVEHAADSLIVHDPEGRIIDANPRACESLGYAHEELLGMNMADVEVERGSMPPAEFIPIAEETDLIIPIGRWVLREACRQGVEWHGDWRQRYPGTELPKMAVNVSARQFQHPYLVEEVAKILTETGFDPRALVLEITESVVMDSAEDAVGRLEKLKEIGVRLAIDDFGAGYSSMNYLKRFPLDLLKIDRSFVEGLGRDSEATPIVSAIVRLARALNLEVVVEGVETADQLEHLRDPESNLGQGYYLAEPLPSKVASALLQRNVPTGSNDLPSQV